MVEKERNHWQHQGLRERNQECDPVPLQGAIALDFDQERLRHERGGQTKDDEKEQREHRVGEVPPLEHLQLQQRDWVEPLVEGEQREGECAEEDEDPHLLRVKPVLVIAVVHQRRPSTRPHSEEHCAPPVELAQALVARLILRQAVPDEDGRDRAKRQRLKKTKRQSTTSVQSAAIELLIAGEKVAVSA